MASYADQLSLLRRIDAQFRDGNARRIAKGTLHPDQASADEATLMHTLKLLGDLATVERPHYEASLLRFTPAAERDQGWAIMDVRADLPGRTVPTLSTIKVKMTGYCVEQGALALNRLVEAMRAAGVPSELNTREAA
jgi:hypothetical protein